MEPPPAPVHNDGTAARCPYCFNCPCLLEQGLYRSIVDLYEETQEDDNNNLTSKEIRFRLYRHATSWIHGFLGKGRRIELPLCVRGEIVDLAPAERGETYVGFKAAGSADQED